MICNELGELNAKYASHAETSLSKSIEDESGAQQNSVNYKPTSQDVTHKYQPTALKDYLKRELETVDWTNPPGLAGDICRDIAPFESRILPTARPIAALSLIARMSAHRNTIGGGKVSFLALVSAESAVGKDSHQQYQKLMLNAVGHFDSVIGEPRSDKQMIEALAEHEHLIYIIDEVHALFDKATSKNASPHDAGILSLILNLSTTRLFVFPYRIKKVLIAQSKKDIEELSASTELNDEDQEMLKRKQRILEKLTRGWRDPYLGFTGYSTPSRLDVLINPNNIQSGLIGRFIFIRVLERGFLNRKRGSEGPSRDLVERCSAMLNSSAELKMTEAADLLLERIIEYFELDEYRNHPKMGAIYARGVEHVKRIASLLAMETSIIDEDMIKYAMRLFMLNIQSCSDVINSESHEKVVKLLEQAYEIVNRNLNHGPKSPGFLANQLVKCSAYIRERRSENNKFEYQILHDMEEAGSIVPVDSRKYYVLPHSLSTTNSSCDT